MTSTVLDLTVTPFNDPVVLGFRVGTGPSETRSVGGSLHLQKGLCRLSLATTVPGFSFLFSSSSGRYYKLTGTCFSLHLFFCLFLCFHRNIRDKNGPF